MAMALNLLFYKKKSTIMAFIDYYKIMGVAKDTPQEKIKDAYKKRVKQFHPDLHPDDPKAQYKFQALQEANTVLSDPEKRKLYDQYGERWKEAEQMQQQGGGFHQDYGGGGFDFSQFEGMGGGGGFSDFFKQMFGGGGFAGGAGFNSAGFARGAAGQGGCGGHGCHTKEPEVTNSQITIGLTLALLGGEINLKLSGGAVRLKIKPGTQPGTKMRLPGKGSKRADGTAKDLILTINVKLPTSLNEEQQKRVRELNL
jgi:curved DNA-binding protein